MSQRICLIFLGLILGCFAIYFGDGVGMFLHNASTSYALLKGLIMLITIVVGVIGLVLCFVGTYAASVKYENLDNQEIGIYVLIFVLFSYMFGVLATPFTAYGPLPWYWKSMWDVLLILGLTPLATCSITSNFFYSLRAKK